MMKTELAFAILMICAVTAITASAQTFTTLARFDYTDGAYPVGPLVQSSNGNFYGVANGGGANAANCPNLFGIGCGALFEITPSGRLATLYSFCPESGCSDGESPNGGLVLATNGNLYGTTYRGGANGHGTVFAITPSGNVTTIYSFCDGCDDGVFPIAGLVLGANGNLYGSASVSGAYDGGTIFEITPAGILTTLHAFCSQPNCADGAVPEGTLIQASNGNFYGTTISGGASDVGTVFELTQAGKFTLLHSFCSQPNCTDGKDPFAGLVQATNGELYGTTAEGGEYGYGTIFEITLQGKLTTLYSFCSAADCADGEYPDSGLIQGTDGNIYGTAGSGGNISFCGSVQGPIGCGTAFEMTLTGTFSTIYTFCPVDGCSAGAFPGQLLQATNGIFYGLTDGGGTGDNGTVFSLSTGLGAFVAFIRASGKTGQTAGILGQGLTGATSVSFNGVPATFAVRRDTFLVATVPAGAMTGYVTVTTPTGTLTSNVKFNVLP